MFKASEELDGKTGCLLHPVFFAVGSGKSLVLSVIRGGVCFYCAEAVHDPARSMASAFLTRVSYVRMLPFMPPLTGFVNHVNIRFV